MFCFLFKIVDKRIGVKTLSSCAFKLLSAFCEKRLHGFWSDTKLHDETGRISAMSHEHPITKRAEGSSFVHPFCGNLQHSPQGTLKKLQQHTTKKEMSWLHRVIVHYINPCSAFGSHDSNVHNEPSLCCNNFTQYKNK